MHGFGEGSRLLFFPSGAPPIAMIFKLYINMSYCSGLRQRSERLKFERRKNGHNFLPMTCFIYNPILNLQLNDRILNHYYGLK